MKYLFVIITVPLYFLATAQVTTKGAGPKDSTEVKETKSLKTLYGIASYYADKFNGRETTSGEVYDGTKMTAACNVLPLGTWIRVTNLSNQRSVVVKTNDRLHARMTRVVDLSRAAAEKLGYIGKGLTKVKVEVLEKVGTGRKK